MSRKFFTSESVTEGHPDKICDQISDAILTQYWKKTPTGVSMRNGSYYRNGAGDGEISTDCYVDIPKFTPDS